MGEKGNVMDISMCENKICIFKKNCYRYNAIPNPNWQSYSNFDLDEELECDSYWPISTFNLFDISSLKNNKDNGRE